MGVTEDTMNAVKIVAWRKRVMAQALGWEFRESKSGEVWATSKAQAQQGLKSEGGFYTPSHGSFREPGFGVSLPRSVILGLRLREAGWPT